MGLRMPNISMPDVGSAVGAGLGSVAGFAGLAGMNLLGTQMTNAQNREIASDNRAWEEAMSGSAYQRAVADMEKAGLNKGMMFGSGSAASTPTPPTPTMEKPDFTAAANSALQAYNTMKQGQVADSQIKLNTANALSATSAKNLSDLEYKLKRTGLPSAEMGGSFMKWWQDTFKDIGSDVDKIKSRSSDLLSGRANYFSESKKQKIKNFFQNNAFQGSRD